MNLFTKAVFFFVVLQFIVCTFFNEKFLDHQFNLKNNGEDDLIEGLDHNALGLLVNESLSGEGVVTKFVGYGIAHHYETDDNLLVQHCYNYFVVQNSSDDSLFQDENGLWGTAQVVGVKNGECIIGIAYHSKFVVRKVRDYSLFVDEELIAQAIWDNSTFDRSDTSITHLDLLISNEDSFGHYAQPPKLIEEAINNATLFGRNGRGTIFASSRKNDEFANLSPYCKIRQVIIVVPLSGAGFSLNTHTPHLVNVLLAGIVGDTMHPLYTATLSFENSSQICGWKDQSTHASYNIVGLVALALEANPDLNWLDVQYLLVKSARYDKLKKYPYIVNGKNLKWSPYYGFGVPDGQLLVSFGKNFESFSKEESVTLEKTFDGKQIHYNRATEFCFNVTNSLLTVFQAQIEISLTDAAIGFVEIVLKSPYQTEVSLTSPNHDRTHTFDNYPFTTRIFFGERSDGLWKVQITNFVEAFTPLLTNLKLSLFGVSSFEDPDPAPLPPDPTPTPSLSPSPSPSLAPSSAPTLSPSPIIANETIIIRFSSSNVVQKNAIYLLSFFILMSLFLL
ncbi:neuroendocrine convertase [Anaeramoeba flamelloides]|uniref:Neuroendocrine convertase n=1 Tax=Anaeramoeba flamelloides TaxID=1746091 RepID=A0AAV8A1L5_9EUKA|nr:neuroendocrine convertase [Anaeramoeba flamelloides]